MYLRGDVPGLFVWPIRGRYQITPSVTPTSNPLLK